MKKIVFSFTFLLFLLSFSFNEVQAEGDSSEVQIFDETNTLIETIHYEKEEIEERKKTDSENLDSSNLNSLSLDNSNLDIVPLSAASIYSFGATSFSNFLWLRSGYNFYNPGIMDFEISNRIDKMAVEVYKSNGSYAGKVVWQNKTGWAALDWRDVSYVTHPGYYKFKFANEGSGSVQIKHGNLYHNYN